MKLLKEIVQVGPDQSFYVGCFRGDERCAMKYWHFHPEYEIVFINQGKGTREIGNHSSSYQQGELILLGPNIPHLAYKIEPVPENYEVVIQFGQPFVDKVLGFAEMSRVKSILDLSAHGIVFGDETKSKVGTYIHDLLKPGAQALYSLMRLLRDLSEASDLSILKAQALQITKPDADAKRVEKIYHFISTHYREEISLQALATEVGLTKNSLCRFFKQVTGSTILSFIHQYRISQSRELLEDSAANVSEIAFQSGFNDVGFFNRKFREVTGTTPTAYRKSIRRYATAY